MTEKFTKKEVWVVIGAALYYCAAIGLVLNCMGTFLAQIRAEYAFSMARVSAFNTLRSVSGLLLGALVTRLLFKLDAPRFMMGVIILEVAAFILLAAGADTLLWFVCPFLIGPSTTVSVTAVPYLLNHRLKHHAGTATGFAMAFSGIAGVITNPFSAFLVETFNWRIALLILSALTLLMAALSIWMIFHGGAPRTVADATPISSKTAQAQKTGPAVKSRFMLCCICFLSGTVCTLFVPLINIFAEQCGYSIVIGATMASVIMVGNLLGKVVCGVLCDLVGTWKSMILCIACVLLGTLGFLFLQRYLPALYLSALLFGFSYSLGAVGVTKTMMQAYGVQASKRYSGIHTSINSGIAAAASLGIGTLHDITGSFQPVLIMMCILSASSLISVFLLMHQCKDDPQSQVASQ